MENLKNRLSNSHLLIGYIWTINPLAALFPLCYLFGISFTVLHFNLVYYLNDSFSEGFPEGGGTPWRKQ
jgi:hypothetical protein